MKIQFFGAKQDSKRVHDAFHKMVERGRVGNITFMPASLTFREEALLQIEVCTHIIARKIKMNSSFERSEPIVWLQFDSGTRVFFSGSHVNKFYSAIWNLLMIALVFEVFCKHFINY